MFVIFFYIVFFCFERGLVGKIDFEKVRVFLWFVYFVGELYGVGWGVFVVLKRFVDVSDKKLEEGVKEGGKKNIKVVYEYLEIEL